MSLLITYILNIIDYIFTSYWVKTFGIEAELNPIGQWMYENNLTWFFKIVVIGAMLALIRYSIKKCPRISWIAYVLLIAYIAVVISHFMFLLMFSAI